jgi:hypothetical protein
MLVIYLHHSQVGLLEVLREVCPDLALAPRSLYPGYVTYRAALAEGKAGLGQTACLRKLHILYLDTEAMRERRARAFMRYAALEPDGERALSFSFARVQADDPRCHRVRVRSRESEATLYLRENWTGREQAPFASWVGALWVYREEDRLMAYSMNERGLPERLLSCQFSEHAMDAWLLENRYLRLYRLSHTPDPCGLYCRIHEDGLPDVTRADR